MDNRDFRVLYANILQDLRENDINTISHVYTRFRAQVEPTDQLVADRPNPSQRQGSTVIKVRHRADSPPPRFELFLLDAGEKKIELEEETRT